MMIPLTIEAIKDSLISQKFDVQFQPETNQLYLVNKIQERELPVFIRIFESSPLVQVLAFLPVEVNKTAVHDTSRLLHLLNKEVDLPGFGMDEQMGLVYYRVMLPALDNKVDGRALEMYLNTVEKISETLAPVIFAISTGAITFQQALEKAREEQTKQPRTNQKV